MFRRYDEILRQNFEAGNLWNVEQNAAPEDRLDRIDSMAFEARCVCLNVRHFFSAIQLAVAGEVTKRVDVSADVCAQRDSFRSGTAAAGIHVIAVLFVQSVEKRRVRRMVRDARVIGLREINGSAAANSGNEVSNGGHVISVLAHGISTD